LILSSNAVIIRTNVPYDKIYVLYNLKRKDVWNVMPKATVICFISSLLSYGMGSSKISSLKNAVTVNSSTYDSNILVSIATGYFVLAIIFALTGFFFYIIKQNKKQKCIKLNDMNFRRTPRREREIA